MKRETLDLVINFRDKRNWKQFHNPKDLAISLSIEASELLEAFQWSGADLVCEDKVEIIKDELADVLIYSLLLADAYGLDIDGLISEKLMKNEIKYPVEQAYGSSKKYTEFTEKDRKGD
jgi:NTP pyrophosphatase (non-canonical NTP hydrolase)